MKKIIEDLKWRYATKKYDPSKKLTEEQVVTIKESLRLTPTAYGLQALKFLMIETPEIREEIKGIAFGQAQVVDASHLIVICSHTHIDESYIDAYAQRVARHRNTPEDKLIQFSEFLKKNLLHLEQEKVEPWNDHQAYIALGQLLHTCASMRVDATPMEGFDAAKLDELLQLKEKGLKSVLLCPVGFRSEEDAYQHLAKVRKSTEEAFETI